MKRLTPGGQPSRVFPNLGVLLGLKLLHRTGSYLIALNNSNLCLKIGVEIIEQTVDRRRVFEIQSVLVRYRDFHRRASLIDRSLGKREQKSAQTPEESDEEKRPFAPAKNLPVLEEFVSFRS